MLTFSFKNSFMVTVCALLFLLQLSAAVPQYYGGYGGDRGGYGGGYGGYGGWHYHDAIVDHGDHHHHVPLHCDTFHYDCHVGK